jgi:bacterioferritin
MFLAEVPDEQGHAQYLADQIAVLGGTPTTLPRPVPEARKPKEMLQRILESEGRAITITTSGSSRPRPTATPPLKVALENRWPTKRTTNRWWRGSSPDGPE